MNLLASLVFLLSLSAGATILPPNDLYLEDNLFTEDANINEQSFNKIIDDIIAIYKPLVAAHGAVLSTNSMWTNSTVNASAQQTGNSWVINMYGGLARRAEVTPDGFAMVVCHELGHHLAGFPFYGNADWAASEGQSDYFATQSCARKIWANDLVGNAEARNAVHPIAKAKCDATWSTVAEQNFCYRTAMAGYSLAHLLSALGGTTASFETPDASQVSSTSVSHPEGQCRLDTYFSGALCIETFDPGIIPGKGHPAGQTSQDAEIVAASYSCTTAAFHNVGFRPRCWFKPEVESLLFVKEMTVQEVQGNNNQALEPGETADLWFKLENLANRAYQNVRAVITSVGNKFDVIKGEVIFSSIGPKSDKAQDNPFEIKLSNLTCGEKFNINLELGLENGKKSNIQRTLQVGKLVTTAPINQSVNQPIPDNVATGLTSQINVAETGTFAELQVTVDITHPYIGDLTIKLISPDAKEFVLHRKEGGGSDNLKKTFKMELPAGIATTGAWKLNVNDTAARDEGALNSWGLIMTKAVCE